jgi:hypothetical protein
MVHRVQSMRELRFVVRLMRFAARRVSTSGLSILQKMTPGFPDRSTGYRGKSPAARY